MTEEEIYKELEEMSEYRDLLLGQLEDLEAHEAFDPSPEDEQCEPCPVCTTVSAMRAIDQVILNTLTPQGELSRKSVKNLRDLGELKLILLQSIG